MAILFHFMRGFFRYKFIFKFKMHLGELFLVVLEIVGHFDEIALQPRSVELDGFDRLLDSSFCAGEVVSLEEVFNFLRFFFARKILRQVLHQACQQESTLVLVQQNLPVLFEISPRQVTTEWVDSDTRNDKNGVLSPNFIRHRELDNFLKQLNIADTAECPANSVFFLVEICGTVNVQHLIVDLLVS